MKTIAEWHTCKAEEQALLYHCKTVVHRLVPGAMLVLYGSRARGEATSASDFDLLILVDGEILPELGAQIDNALYDIELEYGGASPPSSLTDSTGTSLVTRPCRSISISIAMESCCDA